MTPSARWLVVVGWGMPVVVAVLVLAARPAPPARASALLTAVAVLLLVAPVLPLSLILLSIAAVAGRRARRHAPGEFQRADAAFLRLANVGVGLCMATIAAVVLAYVS